LVLRVDRVLLAQEMMISGFAVHLHITRDEDCQGMTVKCTPLRSPGAIASGGPIFLHVTDKELEVLLVDQRGLYDLALKKWSAMEAIARWLVSRLEVRRIVSADAATQSASSPSSIVGGNNANGNIEGSVKAFEKLSISSGKDLPPLKSTQELSASGGSTSSSGGGSGTGAVVVKGKETLQSDAHQGGAIELVINRNVEFLNSVEQQWKSRNVPYIPAMKTSITAYQEMDMLVIQVELSIPHVKIRVARSTELIDYNTYEGDKYDDLDDLDLKTLKPTIIKMSYRLTSDEMMVFGETDVVDAPKVTLHSSTEEEHPATFMWNVLSRLKVELKVVSLSLLPSFCIQPSLSLSICFFLVFYLPTKDC
jgi:hypothetical protein